MPRIFDNIELLLTDGLNQVLAEAVCCSFCVGYFNLRGWRHLADWVEQLPGGSETQACRILVGMHRPPETEMQVLQRASKDPEFLDGPTRAKLIDAVTQSFKRQLEFGIPTEEAETTLRRLANALRQRKVILKAFLRYPLHAKLYLVERRDPATPLIGFVGSSNLTMAGLSRQGELNVDVVEQDAAEKLRDWFNKRWNDDGAVDLTNRLAELIETSWVSRQDVRPYWIYLCVARHLLENAEKAEREIKIPAPFNSVLLNFQKAAVCLAARKLHRQGGVLLGDVVGLGKTLMAIAIAYIMQQDKGANTLVICPPKLIPLWHRYMQEYKIAGHVLSLGQVGAELERLPRYQLVIIDESHNLRNREGKRYKAIRDYIRRNESYVLLLTATPYNKHYTDVSSQLALFLDEKKDLHIRPERYIQQRKAQGETDAELVAKIGAPLSCLLAFEESTIAEDWQDLMRLFLVRRTRQFIREYYAKFDTEKQRYYVPLGKERHYFPRREPRRKEFPVDPSNPDDLYARLFSEHIVEVIENLKLPRYGLANYLVPEAESRANSKEQRILANLNRAGPRLIGFTRTNFFKRLESSGHSFLLSVRRHVLRNLIALYAYEHGLPIPIGAQDVARLDTAVNDFEEEFDSSDMENDAAADPQLPPAAVQDTWDIFWQQAAKLYEMYRDEYADRFDWLDARFFCAELAEALRSDSQVLLQVLKDAGEWHPEKDAKLQALYDLLMREHGDAKVLVFTQFADTARYLYEQLRKRGVEPIALLTTQDGDPEVAVRRFSPSTNGGLRPEESELRILIATDVLSEGQNLQDAHIVVNYDLPWAIIRLIQRAGRVDRLGQKHDTILVYSFWPAEQLEKLIQLRERLVHRLRQNNEVFGSDDIFFGDEGSRRLRELYTEKAEALEDEGTDEDVDLESLAFQVWRSASEEDRRAALALPRLVSSARALTQAELEGNPPGMITYLRYPDGADVLIRVDEQGRLVSQSLSAIFRALASDPATPPAPRAPQHYELIRRCVELAEQGPTDLRGNLGNRRSVRRKLWQRLDQYRQSLLVSSAEERERIQHIMDLIYNYPLRSEAEETIRRQLGMLIPDNELVKKLVDLAESHQLCVIPEKVPETPPSPEIICALGLVRPGE